MEKAFLTQLERDIEQHTMLAELLSHLPGSESKMQALAVSLRKDALALQVLQSKAFSKYLRGGEAILNAQERKALATLTGPDGGYAVPLPLVQETLSQALAYSPIRQYATVRTLTVGDAYPLPKETTRPHCAWKRETDPHTVMTAMTFAGEWIPTHSLVSTISVSSKFVEDPALDIEQWLITSVRNALLVEEGTQFVIGTGIGKPEGLLVHPTVASVNSGHASTLTGDGITTLFYALPEAYRRQAIWLMNRNTIEAVKQLKDSQNLPLYRDGWFGMVPDTIHGRPVVECPDMPDIAANSEPILFGDLSRYYIIDRVDLAVIRDPFSDKPNVVFDCTRRVGGQIVDANAFRKQKVAA